MSFAFALLFAFLLVLASGAILAMKFFFPHHRKVSFVLYVIGFIPFFYAIYEKKQDLLEYQEIAHAWISIFWVHALFLLVILFVSYVLFVLFPLSKNAFVNMDFDKIIKIMSKDRQTLFELNNILKSKFEKIDEDFFELNLEKISIDKKEKMEKFWFEYLEIMFKIRMLRNKYKTFFVLDSNKFKNLYKEAFLNGYYAFTMQNFYSLQLYKHVKDNNMKTFLNQNNQDAGFSVNMFDKTVDSLTKFSEIIRLNIGRIFFKILKNEKLVPLDLEKNINFFLSTVDKNTSFYARLLIVKPLKLVEKIAYKFWYPVQKRLAIRISKIKTTLRENHINEKVINRYRNEFKPCDIFLERKEWRITNIGIPGFWTHSAMYLGKLSELDKFFDGTKELNGSKFSEYIKHNFPEVFKKIIDKDKNNFEFSVIESIRDGVVFTSLEYSANVDSLAVLRVKNLSKSQRLKIVLNAFKYYGTPYDFNYSFTRYDGMLCSELIYKSYQGVSNMNVEFEYINGEPVVTPNMFAKKFAKEYNTKSEELKLVLFLDGDEKDKIARKKGKKSFVETWKRPMWHIVKDYF